jgi:hypothetical protein
MVLHQTLHQNTAPKHCTVILHRYIVLSHYTIYYTITRRRHTAPSICTVFVRQHVEVQNIAASCSTLHWGASPCSTSHWRAPPYHTLLHLALPSNFITLCHHTLLHCRVSRCTLPPHSGTHYRVSQYSNVRWIGLQYITLQYLVAVCRNTPTYVELAYSISHCSISLPCALLHVTLHSIVLHYVAFLIVALSHIVPNHIMVFYYCIIVHYCVSHYSALHCTLPYYNVSKLDTLDCRVVCFCVSADIENINIQLQFTPTQSGLYQGLLICDIKIRCHFIVLQLHNEYIYGDRYTIVNN